MLSGLFHLLYFTSLQLLIYCDRAVLPGFLLALEDYMGLDSVQQGMLGSGFLGGFMVLSPVTALLGKGKKTMYVIAIGLCVWVASVVGTCFSPSYVPLLIARIGAGAGEAAFCALAPPIIDDTAPEGKRSLYIAVYFSAIYLGYALGFGIQGPFKTWNTGRFLFLGEGVVMLPFVLSALFFSAHFYYPGKPRKSTEPRIETDVQNGLMADPEPVENSGTWYGGIVTVLTQPVYTMLLFGYAATIFTVGGFAFWAPTYVEQTLHTDKGTAGFELSAATAISGLVGTSAGGWILDHRTRARSGKYDRLLAGAQISFVSVCIALPLALAAVWVKSSIAFISLLGLTELFVFLSTAPVNVAMMEAVPEDLRGLALGICTMGIHLLGDLIPPILIGWMEDWCGSLQPGVCLLASWLGWAVLWWAAAVVYVSRLKASQAPETGEARMEM